MNNNEKQIIKKIIKLINDTEINEIKNLSLKSISHKLKYHESYLSKIFKGETKILFSSYLRKKKLDTAANLILTNQSLKIGEIAEIVGYFKYDHFRKIFKKQFSVPPNEFKNNFKNKFLGIDN